jgi:hypothetical protein
MLADNNTPRRIKQYIPKYKYSTIKSWEDVFYAVSKECNADPNLPNFTEDDVKKLHYDLWRIVSVYLRNPHMIRKSLLLNSFFKFEFRQKFINKKLRIYDKGAKRISFVENYYRKLKFRKNLTREQMLENKKEIFNNTLD